MQHIYPVILSGGSGTRLWPASQPQMPKQFLPLTSDHSVLQETVLRLRGLSVSQPPTFVCNQVHQYLIQAHLAEISAAPHAILIEPYAKNTAPAIAAAAFQLLKTDPDAVMLVLPSDHVIQNSQALADALKNGYEAACQNQLVTFGVHPTRAHTGYGYIQQGEALDKVPHAYRVSAFKEKPDEKTAEAYLESGDYSWNSGMFLFRAQAFLDELNAYQPDMWTACQKAIDEAERNGDFIYLEPEAFQSSPSDSIDYAVMERTHQAVVIRADMGWSDIGTWSSLWEISPKDTQGNAAKGNVYFKDSQGCLVQSDKFVAILGADDLIIIDTENALLIARKTHEQHVKGVSEMLSKALDEGAR